MYIFKEISSVPCRCSLVDELEIPSDSSTIVVVVATIPKEKAGDFLEILCSKYPLNCMEISESQKVDLSHLRRIRGQRRVQDQQYSDGLVY